MCIRDSGSTLDNGEGLKWTVLETTPRTSELCFELANDPSGHSVQDWTEAKALDFYIDLSTYGNETTGLYLRLTEKDSRDGADAVSYTHLCNTPMHGRLYLYLPCNLQWT